MTPVYHVMFPGRGELSLLWNWIMPAVILTDKKTIVLLKSPVTFTWDKQRIIITAQFNCRMEDLPFLEHFSSVQTRTIITKLFSTSSLILTWLAFTLHLIITVSPCR